MSRKSKRRASAEVLRGSRPIVKTVVTPISVEGLEGQVEIVSLADEDLLGITHQLVYRSEVGVARLNCRFNATLTDATHAYQVAKDSEDTVSPDGKRWTHTGGTRTGSRQDVWATAYVTTSNKRGGSQVSYSISAEYPWSEPYTGSILSPFT